MPIAPVAVGDVDKPFSVVPQQTQWRRLIASDIESEVDPNSLKTSIADADTEIQFRGSVSPQAVTNVDDCYIALFDVVDPDTGEAVDWSSGEYLGVDVWFKFGTNDPTGAAKSACFLGAYGPSNTVLSTGLFTTSGGTFLAAGLYSNADRNATTLTDDSCFYGNITVAPDDDETNVNVLWAYTAAYHFDDASTPGRLQSCLTAALGSQAGASIKIMLAMAGDIDVAPFYRLVKVPNDPQTSLSGN